MKTSLLAILGLAVAIGSTSSFGQDSVHSLNGVWRAIEGNVILGRGVINTIPDNYDEWQVTISDQQGAVFKATQTVKPKSGTPTGKYGEAPMTGQTTPLIGAVDGTGSYLMMVDIEDTTTFRCNVVNDETMRCILAEPGKNAVAGFALMKRAE